MMARIRKSMEEKDQGFTLIELLVVMIIIGILAAIAVPVFLSQRSKARETSAKSDVTNISKDLATYYVDGSDPLTVAGPVSVTPVGATTPIANGYKITSTLSGTAQVGAGRLSDGVKIINTGTSFGARSATDYCIAVQSGYATGGTGSSSDQIWKVTQDGLTKGSCA